MQDRFLEFVKRNPEALDRASFGPLLELEELIPNFPVQRWPLFVDESWRRAFSAAAVAVSRLVRSLPVRVFENDPVRLSEFYGDDAARMEILAALLETTRILEEALGRGDFLLTCDGRLQCLELNMAGGIGGLWEPIVLLERFQRVPLLRRFLEENGVVPGFTNSLDLLFEHLVERSLDLAQSGELSLAIAASSWIFPPRLWRHHMESSFRAALDRRGLDGTLHLAPLEAFTERGGDLWLEGRCIHVLLEGYLGSVSGPVLTASMSGRTRVYNGPVTGILSDKRNLALLSELADSDLFTVEERRDIELYVPWTRRLETGFTSWRDERAFLPDLVTAERERFVLKPSNALGGEGVLVGRRTEPEAWSAALDAALDAPGWLVQEAVEPACHLLQAGDSGCAPFHTVWGLFTFGDTYGGTFPRMAPASEPSGVINAARGAHFGLVLDVSDEV